MNGSEKISPTAWYTAQTWVELGFPRAELFATTRGRALVRAYALLERLRGEHAVDSLLVRSLRNRHHTLDAAVLAHRPDRVVELGAGLSPRSIHLALDHGIDCVDVDLPRVLETKRRLVSRRLSDAEATVLARHHRAEAIDVTSVDLDARLAAVLDGAARPVVVAEGLVGYFDDTIKARLLGSVARALARSPEGLFLCDVRIATPETERAMGTLLLGIRILTRGRGASQGFASAEAALALARAAGFAHAELLPRLDERAPPVLSRILRACPSADREDCIFRGP